MVLNSPVLLGWFDHDLLLRLGAAAALGLIMGLDRELRGHPAGLRTHGLVCFASATMTVAMIALYYQMGRSQLDALRIFEATGAFIGIIGAGLIVFSKGQVRNLTTAVHLWLTAIVGIACGAALWPLVAAGAVISLVMLTILGLAEKKYFPDSETEEK